MTTPDQRQPAAEGKPAPFWRSPTLGLAVIIAAFVAAAVSFFIASRGQPEAPPTSSGVSPSVTPASTSSASSSPEGLLPLGKSHVSPDEVVTATVYAYKQPVARSAPRPGGRLGFEWAAADIKVCVNDDYAGGQVSVSNASWVLVYADTGQIEPSKTGYESFLKPEYPWRARVLTPGRCVRGWITYPVPATERPVAVEYAAKSEPVPPRWAVR
ncbi:MULTISPECIES: hypothetical protein [Micromonospora]|uniref:hypothetical protein n=1 Tax=Micromonospora TaxID=1873 RepID=UPI0013C447CF|nr:hypothetical protein [Micromonospora tulbaghiae]